MKTAPTNKKIREIISMVKEGKLIPRPEFQRRLVWTRDDKNHFLDSILRGFPFPEIYFADGDVDLETGQGTQLLVDGLQRVSTIIQYFQGDPELKLISIAAYKDLAEEEKKSFLQYDVAVRDLGALRREEVVEVFRRINATKYSLNDIEVNHAVYAGALKRFAENLASDKFFMSHNVFTSLDFKRMGDLRFALLVTITMMGGYFNRDDAFEDYLDRYNDDFPHELEIINRIHEVFSFIEECGFAQKERIWRKADLFTIIIELDYHFNSLKTALQPSDVIECVQNFYKRIDETAVDDRHIPGIYYKAAIQASNDRVNRMRRGVIMSSVIAGESDEKIGERLKNIGLAT